jgi:UDP-2,3-diacylglucosamine pyrophosphatase LpxH
VHVGTSSTRRWRTIWISDLHLGTRECKADDLLAFLRAHESETLYLVGDVFDGWRLERSWFWAQSHNDVVQKILRKARKGTRVVYLPGNHDAFARQYVGHAFGGVEVADRVVHETANGRRLLVVHGDCFDGDCHQWLVPLGNGVLAPFRWLQVPAVWRVIRRLLGRPYRSFAGFVKTSANRAVAALGRFERCATDAARKAGCAGVVCGHVHVPAMREIDGVLYLNDGDWVDSCTALAERFDGSIVLLRTRGRKAVATPLPEPARTSR